MYNNTPSYGYQSDSHSYFEDIKNFLKIRYVFRKNEIYDRLEYKPIEEEMFHIVDKYFKNSVLISLRENRLFCSNKTLEVLLNSNFSETYNPLKDFIEHLPEWDNVDYIQQLADSIDTNDNDLFLKTLTKWLVGIMGALSSNGNVINHIFPILTGGQSINKTIWIRRLIPKKLEPFYFEGAINTGNMEGKKKFAENAIIYLIELQPETKQNKFEELKSFIASKEKIRRIYSKNAASRMASVIGSAEQRLNNDIIGNKMVICFKVNSVNYDHQIPMEMVFAQAFHLFKEGFQYQFATDEIVQINESHEYKRDINIQELVSIYIEPSFREAEETIIGTPTEIVKLLFEESGIERKVTQSDKVKLGQFLSINGFEYFEGHAGIKKYCYKLKNTED